MAGTDIFITFAVDGNSVTYIYKPNGLDEDKVIFKGFEKCTKLPNNFLSGAKYLKNVDLSTLRNVEYIGDGFMSNNPMLEKLDLTFMTKVKHVGTDFLKNTGPLQSIELSQQLKDGLYQ